MGNSVATVAPWLFTNTENTNNAKANVHGAAFTKPDTVSFSIAMCACISVSPSQAMPKIAITARIPAWNTEPLVTAWLSGLQNHKINAPAESITISIVCAMPSGFIAPESSAKAGRNDGIMPITTTKNEAAKKMPSDSLAFLPTTILSSVSVSAAANSAAYSGSCKRRWYSGSSFNSLPSLFTITHAKPIPKMVEGTVTINTSPK